MGGMGTVVAVVLMAVAAAIIFVFLLIPLVKLVVKLIGHIGKTLIDIVADALRFVGSILVIPVFMLLTVGSVIFGRWSATGHYGRAVSGEIKSACLNLYRVAVGHPLRLIGLGLVIDGFEKRLPEVVAAAPGRDKPSGRKAQFEGYTIVGSLAGGGSGARLYIAEPNEMKLAGFERQGIDAKQVVIKAFSLNEGSSLPQIIRESRSLEAAKRLGLVLEHDLTQERFHYVMEYVPGEQLTLITQRAHTDSGQAGLSDRQLSKLLSHGRDLLSTLCVYHTGGLWHKDVKPDNVVVDETGAHLVDLGLITPLRSAMTLTTHGTEYFRDPELVRMALRGVKVNEVDGAKFDIYAAAAVLYSMVENSFPAHGGLSQITRRCPEGIRWIIRRGMTDYDKRYSSMNEMLADLDYVLIADNAFAVKPAQLPSMNGSHVEPAQPEIDENEAFLASVAAARAASPSPRGLHTPASPPAGADQDVRNQVQGKPKITVANWWSGKYSLGKSDIHSVRSEVVDFADEVAEVAESLAGVAAAVEHAVHRPAPMSGKNRPASEQLKNARARAQDRRSRAKRRSSSHRSRVNKNSRTGLNRGAAVAVGVVVGVVSIPIAFAVLPNGGMNSNYTKITTIEDDGTMSVRINGRDVSVSPKDGFTNVAAASDVQESYFAENRGTAVVVSLFESVDDAMQARLNRSIAALENMGFQTIHDILNGNETDQTDLIGEIEYLRSKDRFDLKESERSLKDWLAGHDGKYSLAVVIGPDPRDESIELLAIMAGSEGADSAFEFSIKEFRQMALNVTNSDK